MLYFHFHRIIPRRFYDLFLLLVGWIFFRLFNWNFFPTMPLIDETQNNIRRSFLHANYSKSQSPNRPSVPCSVRSIHCVMSRRTIDESVRRRSYRSIRCAPFCLGDASRAAGKYSSLRRGAGSRKTAPRPNTKCCRRNERQKNFSSLNSHHSASLSWITITVSGHVTKHRHTIFVNSRRNTKPVPSWQTARGRLPVLNFWLSKNFRTIF